MEKISFVPVDATYKIADGKPVVELYGKSREGQVCVQVEGFEPYFWVIDTKEAADEKIVRVERKRKKLLGKEVEAQQVFLKVPGDVPAIREKFKAYEADILFTRRFLIDRGITPLMNYDVEGEYLEGDYKVRMFKASSIKESGDDVPELRVLAVDLETHTEFGKEIAPENDPIIMIGLYGADMKKVLTWKEFRHDEYVEVCENETAMITRLKELIADYKPDMLTGYFSDRFDLPYLRKRAEKLKINLDLSLDNSGIRISKSNRPISELTGIAHIDMYMFIRRMFRTTFTSFRLDDVSQALLGERKIDVNLDMLFRAWNETDDSLGKFAKYNLQDARLTYLLALKMMPQLVELTRFIGMAPVDVSRMSFSQLVEWYLIREAPAFNEIAPNRPGFHEERSRRRESYEGGFVYEPTPGLYKNVAVFDFRSLYPTIISAHNISPDTLVFGRDSEDGVLKNYSFSNRKGFISTVIENVINHRLRIKKLAKKAKDDVPLKARDQALKTIANSIYGYYGFFGARWYNIDCARAITAYGRHHILDVIEKAEKAGLKVLYSDTDSVFIALQDKTIEYIHKFVDGINSNLPGMMELEYEAVYKSGLFVAAKGSESGAKKRYAMLSEDGSVKIRGFETVRRNLSPIAKETQERVLRMVLEDKDREEVISYIKGVLKALREKRVLKEKLTITTQLSRDIKSYANVPPHVEVAKRMKARGERVGTGTVVKYIVTSGEKLVRDRAKLPDEVKEGDYDAEYYITHQVVPSVERILDVLNVEEGDLDSQQQSKLGSFL